MPAAASTAGTKNRKANSSLTIGVRSSLTPAAIATAPTATRSAPLTPPIALCRPARTESLAGCQRVSHWGPRIAEFSPRESMVEVRLLQRPTSGTALRGII